MNKTQNVNNNNNRDNVHSFQSTSYIIENTYT